MFDFGIFTKILSIYNVKYQETMLGHNTEKAETQWSLGETFFLQIKYMFWLLACLCGWTYIRNVNDYNYVCVHIRFFIIHAQTFSFFWSKVLWSYVFKEFFLKAYLCCTIFTKEVELYTAVPWWWWFFKPTTNRNLFKRTKIGNEKLSLKKTSFM